MIASFVISFLLVIYSGLVIRKKVKEVKTGKLCSCSCEGCSGCGKNK